MIEVVLAQPVDYKDHKKMSLTSAIKMESCWEESGYRKPFTETHMYSLIYGYVYLPEVHRFGIGSTPALGTYAYTISGINFEHPTNDCEVLK